MFNFKFEIGLNDVWLYGTVFLLVVGNKTLILIWWTICLAILIYAHVKDYFETRTAKSHPRS